MNYFPLKATPSIDQPASGSTELLFKIDYNRYQGEQDQTEQREKEIQGDPFTAVSLTSTGNRG
jgi:hypothetical protein